MRKFAYPTFELIEKNYGKLKDKKPGFKNICVSTRASHPGRRSAARPPRRHA